MGMISVVCIHYNDPDMLLGCLTSVAEQTGVQTEVIIVDNSSNFPLNRLSDLNISYQYIDQGYNSGFARGVNAGLRAAKGEHILMLNQDASLSNPATLSKCMAAFRTLPEKTIMGINLLDAGGHHQRSVWPEDPGMAKEWRTSPIYIKLNRHRQTEQQFKLWVEELHKNSGYVHRINGAFLLFHRSLVDKYQLYWDEDFFLYGEDVEWAYRCRKCGWQFYHLAEVAAQHLGSASSSDRPSVTKSSQVLVSDWLAVRKMKGRLYIALLLMLTCFNRCLDIVLQQLAAWRNKGESMQSGNLTYERLQLSLIRKYGLLLVLGSNFSDTGSFKLNCYDG
jgi:GT2 family glycosyltransferase